MSGLLGKVAPVILVRYLIIYANSNLESLPSAFMSYLSKSFMRNISVLIYFIFSTSLIVIEFLSTVLIFGLFLSFWLIYYYRQWAIIYFQHFPQIWAINYILIRNLRGGGWPRKWDIFEVKKELYYDRKRIYLWELKIKNTVYIKNNIKYRHSRQI